MRERKRLRTKLAKSELRMFLAVTAQRWADDIAGKGGGRPFDEWESDGEVDPFQDLARRYGLNGKDLARLCTQLGQELENWATRTGF